MGPKNCEAEDTVLYTADGEKIGKIRDLPEVTVADGKEIASVMCPAMAELSMTLSVEMPKQRSCKGRKRFIKLMMSEGWTRNWAEALASFMRWHKIPYSEAWKSHLRTKWWRERVSIKGVRLLPIRKPV